MRVRESVFVCRNKRKCVREGGREGGGVGLGGREASRTWGCRGRVRISNRMRIEKNMKPGRLMKPSEGPHQRLGAPSEPRWPDLLPSTRRRRSSHLVRPELGGREGRGESANQQTLTNVNWTWPADDAPAAMVAKRNAPGEKAVKIRRSQFKKKHRSNFASLTSSDILHSLIFFFFFYSFHSSV